MKHALISCTNNLGQITDFIILETVLNAFNVNFPWRVFFLFAHTKRKEKINNKAGCFDDVEYVFLNSQCTSNVHIHE